MTQEQFEVTVAKLDGKIDRLTDSVEAVRDIQLETNEKVTNIEKAIYNPDEGLYARLRALEQWQDSQSKIQWFVLTSIFGLIMTTLYKMIIVT